MLQIMCLSVGQFAKTILSPPSSTVGVIPKIKITVISDNVHSQVKVNSTFTTITRFVFDNEKFFTVV